MPDGRKEWTEAECREADRLHRTTDLTWEEIGDQFGVSREQVRKAVYRHTRRKDEQVKADLDTVEGIARPHFPDWEKPERVPWRDWFASWGRTNELHKAIDPSQELLTVDLSTTDKPVAVAFAADLHMGGGYTDHDAIRQTVDYILETEGLYLCLVGDGIEGFIPGMKPAETSEQMPASLKAQLSAYRSLVEELADARKLLFMTWGDHDAKWFENAIGVNSVKREMHDRVPYFNGRGLVKLKLGEQTYWVQANHSERFNSQWNLNHPQRRQYERFFPANVNVSGHKHKPAFQCFHHYSALQHADEGLGGKTWLIATGTFKTGPDPYTIRSWSRGIMGVPTCVFHPDTHDVDCFEGPEKAMAFVRGLGGAA